MSKPPRVRAASIPLLAIVAASCGFAASEKALTVEEVVPRIEELNGQTVSVAGYLAKCGGYSCTLYRTKADSDAWDQVMIAVRANRRVSAPDVPTLGIGMGTKRDFDGKAAPFTNSYVVITGTITNECRFEGERACSDRGPDLKPTDIRAGRWPTA